MFENRVKRSMLIDRKKLLIVCTVLIIIGVTVILFKINNLAIKYREHDRKKAFINSSNNAVNQASAYFARNLDPKILKSEPNIGNVSIAELAKINASLNDFEGFVRIVVLEDETFYYINISNNAYSYSGNQKDLKMSSVK